MPICTQGMQRTWWPEAGIIIVTGPYWAGVSAALLLHTVKFRSVIFVLKINGAPTIIQGDFNSSAVESPVIFHSDKTTRHLDTTLAPSRNVVIILHTRYWNGPRATNPEWPADLTVRALRAGWHEIRTTGLSAMATKRHTLNTGTVRDVDIRSRWYDIRVVAG